MFKLKLSLIVAGIACILSFLIGIISGGSFLIVLIRAAICGIVFFALAMGIYMLTNIFLPELLQPEEREDNLGSHVDILVEDAKTEEEPETHADAEEQEPENNKDSSRDDVSSLDQRSKNEYTKKEQVEETISDSGPAPVPSEISDQQAVSKAAEPPKEKSTETSEESKFWKDIFPQFDTDYPKEIKREYAASERIDDDNKVQIKVKQTDPNKMDRKQMASTIQLMLKQK